MVTSLGTALRQLGPPQRMSAIPGGYVMAWEHWQITESSLGFSLGVVGADFLNVDWGDARTRGDFLLLAFDNEHRLVDSSLRRWDSDAGGGQALQPFFGFVPVVDVDDLRLIMPQHRWGAASLAPLPTAINDSNHPDRGHAGLEQRGTPTGAGQRSLE
jgi:hypothetical protein